jgi:hypothetical protein
VAWVSAELFPSVRQQQRLATERKGRESKSLRARQQIANVGTTFSRRPELTLDSDADSVEYGLTPFSDIETISNFVLGQVELNIDLGAAATSAFEICSAE